MRRIIAGDVKEILCFEPGARPVWLVTFNNGEKLVVKAEIKTDTNHANQNIPVIGMMMNRVSPSLQVEMLDDREFTALDNLKHQADRFRPIEAATESQEYLKLYLSAEGRGLNAYYKMPFFQDLGNIKKSLENGGVRLMLLQLKQPPALFTLGKIAAVDQFIGNYDRFNQMGDVVNAENFLFQKIGTTVTPIGLDFYQAQGEAANLMTPPPDHTSHVPDKGPRQGKTVVKYVWGGENLLNENNIRFFAANAMKNLNEHFQECQVHRMPLRLLDEPDILEFGNGMIAGTLELKRFLGVKMGLPDGVTARMYKLHWPYNPAPDRPSTPAPVFRRQGRAHRNAGVWG
jgi:hypothetical protein